MDITNEQPSYIERQQAQRFKKRHIARINRAASCHIRTSRDRVMYWDKINVLVIQKLNAVRKGGNPDNWDILKNESV